MPIQVTCPKCLKRFQVSDKFAGKTGPCPSCKAQIKVPDKTEEVVVHAPTDDAPKDRSGQSVLKPLKRKETEVTRTGLLVSIGAVLAAIGIAIGMRVTGGTPLAIQILGLVLLAPPLVWAGYQFIYDQELEPYRGAELRNRVLILSVIFVSLWLIYAFAPAYVLELDEASEMSYMTFGITFCIMLAIGAFASVATFEVEFLGGLAHAGLYLLSVVLLAVLSGVTLAGAPVEPPIPGLDRPIPGVSGAVPSLTGDRFGLREEVPRSRFGLREAPGKVFRLPVGFAADECGDEPGGDVIVASSRTCA